MRICMEPRELFMYTVYLAFSQERPEPEDEAVKGYMEEHELIPKGKGTKPLDGEEFEVLYFGGCYMGRHLRVIGDMQRKFVEGEMLTREIERMVNDASDPTVRKAAVSTPEPLLKQLIGDMTLELHQESSFGTDDDGYLTLTVEPALIERKFLERVRGSVEARP